MGLTLVQYNLSMCFNYIIDNLNKIRDHPVTFVCLRQLPSNMSVCNLGILDKQYLNRGGGGNLITESWRIMDGTLLLSR